MVNTQDIHDFLTKSCASGTETGHELCRELRAIAAHSTYFHNCTCDCHVEATMPVTSEDITW